MHMHSCDVEIKIGDKRTCGENKEAKGKEVVSKECKKWLGSVNQVISAPNSSKTSNFRPSLIHTIATYNHQYITKDTK